MATMEQMLQYVAPQTRSFGIDFYPDLTVTEG